MIFLSKLHMMHGTHGNAIIPNFQIILEVGNQHFFLQKCEDVFYSYFWTLPLCPKKKVLNIFNLPNLIMCIQDSYGMLILKVGIQLGSFKSACFGLMFSPIHCQPFWLAFGLTMTQKNTLPYVPQRSIVNQSHGCNTIYK
jgi:hypothetical protein